jgi:hypothetical protein
MMTARKSMIITGVMLLFGALMCFGISPVSAAGPVSSDDPNATCVSCHSISDLSLSFPDGEVLSCYVDYDRFQASKHGAIVRCDVCHADIASFETIYPHPKLTVNTIAEYTVSQYQLCAGCHTREYQDLQASVHGIQNGIQIATCADCHTGHDTLATGAFPPINEQDAAQINTYRLDSVTYCSNCHGDDDLMRLYGLSTNVVNSYLQDFHGKTTYLVGEEAKNLSIQTAVCSDCHKSSDGISLSTHAIALITPANQASIQDSFIQACQRCHPDASASFAAAWLSHNQPGTNYAQAVFGVTWFYRVMIAFVLLGLFIHIGFDVYKRRKNKKEAG